MMFEVSFDSGNCEVLLDVEADDEAQAIQCVREALPDLPYRVDSALRVKPQWQQ